MRTATATAAAAAAAAAPVDPATPDQPECPAYVGAHRAAQIAGMSRYNFMKLVMINRVRHIALPGQQVKFNVADVMRVLDDLAELYPPADDAEA
jgi:hypothetical protein